MAEFDAREFRNFSKHILHKLAVFETACSSGSRIEAGQKLGIDGSQVGKIILELERDLKDVLNGATLIDHSGPLAVVPTNAGRRLWQFAQSIRSASATFVNDLEAMQRSKDIRLAVTHSALLAYAHDLEREYKLVCPEGTLNWGDEFPSRDKVWDDIETRLLEGKADAGIYTYPPSRDKKKLVPAGIAVHPWIEEEMVLVISKKSDVLPKERVVSLQNLPKLERIVHYRRALEFERTTTIEAYLKQQKVLKRYAGDWLSGEDSITAIKDALIRRGGMSFLPWPDVQHEYEQKTLRVYKLDPPMRPRTVRIAFMLNASLPALAKFRMATARLKGQRTFEL